MSTDGTKTFSLTLSPQVMLGIILTALPVLGGSAYAGITFYNKMVSTIEAVEGYKPYDDAELASRVAALEIENKALKERLFQYMESTVKTQEKASEALALGRETKAVADGTSREVKSSLDSIRAELKSTTQSLETQMNTLRRASTNPLGR
jgi:ABC-type phosphate transport system auxiliary subunit